MPSNSHFRIIHSIFGNDLTELALQMTGKQCKQIIWLHTHYILEEEMKYSLCFCFCLLWYFISPQSIYIFLSCLRTPKLSVGINREPTFTPSLKLLTSSELNVVSQLNLSGYFQRGIFTISVCFPVLFPSWMSRIFLRYSHPTSKLWSWENGDFPGDSHGDPTLTPYRFCLESDLIVSLWL